MNIGKLIEINKKGVLKFIGNKELSTEESEALLLKLGWEESRVSLEERAKFTKRFADACARLKDNIIKEGTSIEISEKPSMEYGKYVAIVKMHNEVYGDFNMVYGAKNAPGKCCVYRKNSPLVVVSSSTLPSVMEKFEDYLINQED